LRWSYIPPLSCSTNDQTSAFSEEAVAAKEILHIRFEQILPPNGSSSGLRFSDFGSVVEVGSQEFA
jgi:hypothetical protein